MGAFDFQSGREAAASRATREEESASDPRMKAAMHRRWVQRKAAHVGNPSARGDELEQADTDAGHGVDTRIQRKVESATGADLSGVRVHTGAAANQAASALRAKAYTVEQDVHFANGQYRPGTKEG